MCNSGDKCRIALVSLLGMAIKTKYAGTFGKCSIIQILKDGSDSNSHFKNVPYYVKIAGAPVLFASFKGMVIVAAHKRLSGYTQKDV